MLLEEHGGVVGIGGVAGPLSSSWSREWADWRMLCAVCSVCAEATYSGAPCSTISSLWSRSLTTDRGLPPPSRGGCACACERRRLGRGLGANRPSRQERKPMVAVWRSEEGWGEGRRERTTWAEHGIDCQFAKEGRESAAKGPGCMPSQERSRPPLP